MVKNREIIIVALDRNNFVYSQYSILASSDKIDNKSLLYYLINLYGDINMIPCDVFCSLFYDFYNKLINALYENTLAISDLVSLKERAKIVNPILILDSATHEELIEEIKSAFYQKYYYLIEKDSLFNTETAFSYEINMPAGIMEKLDQIFKFEAENNKKLKAKNNFTKKELAVIKEQILIDKSKEEILNESDWDNPL